MLLSHFKLREQPFGVTPDPTFLYASPTHREALASLVYAIDAGLGFATLTARPGMGKTTLLFETLGKFRDKRKTVFLFQSMSTPHDLIQALLIDLGIANSSHSFVEKQTQLNECLLSHYRAGMRVLLVIDEAQNLNETVLEAVRMLSNFETSREKLIQIILSGQTQLEDMLASGQLLQLRQRISIHGHLEPFSIDETSAYVVHRLRVAGCETANHLFTRASLASIHESSGGTPRNINNICFNALSLAYAMGYKTIDADLIKEVISDLGIDREGAAPNRRHQTVATGGNIKRRAVVTRFLGWGSFLAVASLVVLMFCFLPNRFSIESRMLPLKSNAPKGNPTAGSSAVIPASRSHGSSISIPPPAGALPLQQDPPGTRRVEVREGESLSLICAENLGDCNAETFRLLLRMNTSITDPDYIVSGQTILLPTKSLNATDIKARPQGSKNSTAGESQ